MSITIGVAVTEHVVVGVVENNRVSQAVVNHAAEGSATETLRGIPAETFVSSIADQVASLAHGGAVEAVGLAIPGIVRDGEVVESADLPQFKGFPIAEMLREALTAHGLHPKVAVLNEPNAVAAGIAAVQGQLDRPVRVWTLGDGVGFGCYPAMEGLGEAGHLVVTLDPNERFCGCGGYGHLEGVTGGRAMRLRFLDLEPHEVFASAFNGDDPRCSEFIMTWHRALAAATASTIHMHGPAKYYLSGANAQYANVGLLTRYVQEMVVQSSLQGYGFEIIKHGDEAALIGAAVHAQR